MHTFQVDLGERSYPIYIGQELLGSSMPLSQHIKGQGFIVSNTTVAPLYLNKLQTSLADQKISHFLIPDGEQHKTMRTLNQIFDVLMAQKHDRETTLIALGGGVVGDITGFAAACYQRGVNFIQIPTTLLAQVDSSVGGKTGVNHASGKNMLGAFHQPQCVIADVSTLNTLSDRELKSGLAEVIKYGMLGDREFFSWLETNLDLLLSRDPEALVFAIERSCQNKARIVAQDERETGQRALLNLGHTFGHAIETFTSYKEWTHGEAVAMGMCLAAHFSARTGRLNSTDAIQCCELIKRAGLPTKPPAIQASKFIELMHGDKKSRSGTINLVLMSAIGESVLTSDYDEAELTQFLSAYPKQGQRNA